MNMIGKKSSRWKIIDQSYFVLFLTFSLMDLTNVGAGLVDGLVITHYLDAESMAAAGIAHPIFSIAGIFGGMFAVGMQTLCTRELGRGDVKAFNRLFSAVMILGTAFSLVLMAAQLVWAEPFAALMGASKKGAALAPLAAAYLRGVGIGLPALIMTSVLTSAIQMDSGRNRVLIGAIACFVLDILLDFAAVFLHMGLFGVGLATALAKYLEAAYLLLHFRKKDKMLRFVPLETNVKEILNVLSCGYEKVLRRLANVLRPILLNKQIIFYGGALAMTAMSVQNSVSNFTQLFSAGLADSLVLMVGIFFGEMNDEAIRETAHCNHRNCLIFCGGVCVLLLIFAEPVAGFYVSGNEELLRMTAFTMRIVAIDTPLSALLRSRIAYLQAIGRTRNMQLLSAAVSLFYVVFSAFLIGKLFGAYGILASFLVSDILAMLTVWLYYCIKTRKLLPSPEDQMNLPDDFHRSPGDVIYLDIRDEEDISLVAHQIGLFCKGHGIGEQTGYHAAVCFEELASNIIAYGFPGCKLEPGIDFLLVFSENELILRIKDNCPPFDVERQITLLVNEGKVDSEERIGLKILSRMAPNISYVHTLETNNVILRFPIGD